MNINPETVGLVETKSVLTAPTIPKVNNQFLANDGKLVQYVDSIKTLKEVEQAYIMQVLELLDGNKTKTSKLLGISLKGLYNRLHEMNYNFKKENK